MRRVTFAITALLALSMDGFFFMQSAPAAQFPASYYNSAPADEYFGHMKMSYLGINNTLRDSVIRAGVYTIDSGIISKVNFAADALRAWAAKYPRDPELPHSYFLALQAYAHIYTQDAQDKAVSYLHVLSTRYRASSFGALAKDQLRLGYTVHYFARSFACGRRGRARIPCRVLVSHHVY